MDPKITFADILKRGLKNKKTKPSPPHNKTLKNGQENKQQLLVKDKPVTKNKNDTQMVQSPFENAQCKQRVSTTDLPQNFENLRLHPKVGKTVVENEQQAKQTNLIQKNNTHENPAPLVQPEHAKLNQSQLQQPVLDQLPVRKVVNKCIASVHGNKFEDRYKVGSKLGQGGQGSVYSGNFY